MDFRTWAARTCITHFPEIIVLVTVDDVVCREVLCPVAGSFIVTGKTFFRTSFKYGDIQVFRVQFQYFYQVFVCPANHFFLEVVAE